MCVNVNSYVMWAICMPLKYSVCTTVYVLVSLKFICLRILNDFITDTSTDEKSLTSLVLSSEIMKKKPPTSGGYEHICVTIESFDYMKPIFLKYAFVGINWFNLA